MDTEDLLAGSSSVTEDLLAVLAEAEWPPKTCLQSRALSPADRQVPPLPGFVLSSFNPLVADAAERCLRQRYGQPPVPVNLGDRTAVVLVSESGDVASADHVARTVDAGARVGPLFFFQSVPNSVVGHVAARWGLGGPVVCLCPTGDARAEGLDQAALLIEDGDADEVLVVLVEQPCAAGEQGCSAAVLVTSQPAARVESKVT
jgi:3-oxoacyl-(acyl-carrier-protein) synthase